MLAHGLKKGSSTSGARGDSSSTFTHKASHISESCIDLQVTLTVQKVDGRKAYLCLTCSMPGCMRLAGSQKTTSSNRCV